MYLIILGSHGSGKGTQTRLISQQYKIPGISTGDIFREHMKKDTDFGKKIQQYMGANVYVPDKLTNVVVGLKLKQHKSSGFILDGYPRTVSQAEFLDKILKELGIKIDIVINLQVDKEVLVKRLLERGKKGKRPDDTEEGIKSRMQEYATKAEPVVDYYRKKGIIADVDGDQNVEKVFKDIRSVLDKLI